jgi:cytoskeleton protein RodZ
MSTILSEAPSQAAAPQGAVPQTAGAWLRAARQAQGLHIAALAAQLKVPQAKLEAMEADRHQDLPDATFTRALAKAMCRALKVDAAPVLELLPRGSEPGLDRVSKGLNTPFRERMASEEGLSLDWLKRPMIWGPALLLAGALAVYLVPGEWLQLPPLGTGEPAKSATSGSPEPEAAPAPVLEAPAASAVPLVPAITATPASQAASVVASPSLAAVPAPVLALPTGTPAAAPVQAAPAAALPGQVPLLVKAREESWVEITDAQGQVQLSKLLRPGEQASLNVLPPLRLRVGNVSGTEITLRGSAVDLAAQARDNVVRMELK